MPASTYLANALLNHFLKNAAFAQPTNVFSVLSTADPLNDGSGLAEPSGFSYARQNINTSFGTPAAARSIALATQITYPVATGAWGTISHWAFYDASPAGNMLWKGQFVTAKVVGNTDQYIIKVGNLTLTFA